MYKEPLGEKVKSAKVSKKKREYKNKEDVIQVLEGQIAFEEDIEVNEVIILAVSSEALQEVIENKSIEEVETVVAEVKIIMI